MRVVVYTLLKLHILKNQVHAPSLETKIYHRFCIMDIYILSLVSHMPNWNKIILIHVQHPASAKKIHHIATIIQSINYNSEIVLLYLFPRENLSLTYHGGEQAQYVFDVSFAFTPSDIRRQ